MNEVKMVQTAVQSSVSATSSKGKPSAESRESGKALPEQVQTKDTDNAPKAQPVTAEALQVEVKKN